MRNSIGLSAAILAAAIAPAAADAANVIPSNWSSITAPVGDGVLRPGSPWGPGSNAPALDRIVDGIFAPEQHQWNNDSFWWDQTQTVSPYYITIQLNHSFSFDRLVLQGDDNDNYLVEYWSGGAWHSAFTAAAVNSFGLITRDSGILPSFSTDRFRLSAFGGDQYYAISEFQAFAGGGGVPEPATWAMMILGLGAIGAALRRRRPAATVRFT
ncbi:MULTISPECIES: PEPxxWA-CTERM sorting domain-containing protein [Sphingomonas]|uniref:PEPxxWA-CTERM sorting domain-containing protein n=1 Tax=Sphingomonas TaxID=13687 RepID=UPI00092BCB4B|nr:MULTISPECIES: PEPxxWA-CTERM sorting domain-containing protein [Sphingomonas]MCW6532024.1 PEPxxWA-CTERM sorting domain-containing protein [Sphingomonas lycopersici]OJU15351.1 MAG: hypothetical protein BGN95_12770 [Sphingomonas sp. 66-10]